MNNTNIYHGGSARKGFSSSGGGGGGADEKIKVTENDTVTNYLDEKLFFLGRVNKVISNPGADEKMDVYLGDHYTLTYNNFSNLLSTNDYLRPPDWAIQDNGHAGYVISENTYVIGVNVMLHRFDSDGENNFATFNFRRMIADGSYLNPHTPGQGSQLGTLSISPPDTYSGPGPLHYYGESLPVTWYVPGGYALFVYISFSNINVISGISMVLDCVTIPNPIR